MNREPIILNNYLVLNGDVPNASTFNQTFSKDPGGAVVIQLDESNSCLSDSKDYLQSCQYQLGSRLNDLLQPKGTVESDHDYSAKDEQEENKKGKGNIFLTINLTEYGKHIDVKNICGVVLLLKDNPVPPFSRADVSNTNLPESSTDVNNPVLQNEAIKQNNPVLQNEAIKEEDFICQHCGMVFYFKKVLDNHIRRYHNQDTGFKYDCPKCSKRYQSLAVLSNHIKKVHDVHCEFCEATFKMVADYKEHLKENHKEVLYNHCKPYYCKACDIEFGSKEIYLKHLRSHSGFLCNICLEIFSTKDEHKAHEETHPNKYFCEKCNKGFREKCSLKAHADVHNNIYSFPCPQCDKTFKAKSTLRCHMFVHNPQKNIMCDKCSKMCRNKNQLREHQRAVHDKVKDFQCTVCKKKYSKQNYLKMHYNIMHLKLRPYQCEFCGKQFGRKDFLLAHRMIHTRKAKSQTKKPLRKMIGYCSKKYKDQPVDCSICGKTLKNPHILKLHLNTHARLRKFKCQYCGLMFLHQTSKIRHEKSHEADPEHKFICPVCWKRVETTEKLVAHMELHNNRPKRHICNVCGEAFCRRILLDNHVLSEHTNEEDIDEKEEFICEGFKQAVIDK